MKKWIIAIGLMLLLFSSHSAKASTYQEATHHFQKVSLLEVTTKIKRGERFFLFIGREDNVAAQKAANELLKAQSLTGKTIFYLDAKGVDAKKYKSFSKKYTIKSFSYLAYFANKQQVSLYHNNWQADIFELTAFLEGQP